MKPMQKRARRAFTLVELLVVIAILAVLAAVIYPVYSAARQRAYVATCLANLSQIGKATAIYAADWDSHLPLALSCEHYAPNGQSANPTDNEALDGLVKQLPSIKTLLKSYGVVDAQWHCPADHIDAVLQAEGGHAPTFYQDRGSSYEYDDKDALEGQTLSSFAAPASQPLFWDCEPFHNQTHLPPGPDPSARAGVLYADSHVKCVLWDELLKQQKIE
ncbi:type II secretion system protein [Chthonomonas calidirosea]|nr:type II secretion system protein [Chthonomonas calidirosea]CEK17994.1 prepilin-type N-terminal cleavage/methylation domain-containing protein [Chthonomonas calidirosea]